ncbi:Soyasapogenol B glucuronide galactosyltransferase, partial [Mucuna pruriens]
MEAQSHHQLKVIFLPYPTPGHMIPMVDTARLFAKHGVSVIIITTHANALTFQKAIDSDFSCGYQIRTQVVPFPAAQLGLPDGVENIKDSTTPEMLGKISHGISMLKDQIELLFQDLQPDCIVTDFCYPWTVESATKLSIPRIFFYSSSYFSNCVSHSIRKHRPHESLASDTYKFKVPGLPQRIEMTPPQVAEWERTKNETTGYFDAMFESETRSYGALYNSFHELESDYEQLHKSTMGIKSWTIGPVSAWVNKVDEEKANRGHKEELAQEPEWLNWLNSKQNESVLYVSFGSLTRLPHAQLVELAHGLEHSGHSFIWVVREKDENENGHSFLQEFAQKMKESNKGYIIWNWAPQLLILDHPSIGGIVTHCGWNSILESVSAGLPMITWPMFAEQFYNEKLVVDVLKIGVPVGVKENKFWMSLGDEAMLIREEIVKAVVLLMGSSQESKEMRKRARKLGDAAKMTVEEGGHSYNNLVQLIESQAHQLNFIFVPYLSPGHMNPMVDTARLFAKHGVSVTIITTPANALTFQKAIDNDFSSGYQIRTQVVPFPSAQLGLPEGVENLKDGTSLEMLGKISYGMSMLQDQIELLFHDLQPDCLVTDLLYPWTVESAAKLGIPRLYYFSSSYFASCATHFISTHKPHERLVSDAQKFSIPGLPHNIEMTTLQLEAWVRTKDEFTEFMNAVYESESRSYGTLYNSFHELEGDYEHLYLSTKGIKCWSVGPVSAWVNKVDEEKANRGHKEELAQESEWKNWLNSKQNESVLYLSFGSLTRLSHAQIVEIAHGLENSGHSFIWVVRKKDENENGHSFLQEFEQKMKESNKGYIIWNWAPQLLILDHTAIGGIVTHCGWNSILESVSAGLPMITWPMFAEQFYNEKLVVDVLKIGVPVGAKENKFWASMGEDAVVGREEIAKAVVKLMGKEESRDMRKRARELGDASKKTTEEGGSSYLNLMQLLDELKSLKITRTLEKTNYDGKGRNCKGCDATRSRPHQLNVIFLPYPAPGHMNPMVDTARLFAKHGVSVSIITTPANALTFQKAIDSDFSCGYQIRTHVIQFPSSQVGLPDGVENVKAVTSGEMLDKISLGISMLQDQIELLFQDMQPDCLVTDMLYVWTVESAAKLDIPRIYFYSSSYFTSCATHFISKHKPHQRLVSDCQKFSIPGLPHNIEMTTLQLEEWVRTKNEFTDILNVIYESESRSYGTLYNSFHELEGDYEHLYQSTKGIKCWGVGPVSAWVNKGDEEKDNRENNEKLAQESEWKKWLNSKQNESVLYVSFGSLIRLPHAHLVEIAHGLENSGHDFIWVIRKRDGDGDGDGDSFLQDFEQKMKESKKGYIIWNWAPQLLILNHPAIGGIVTHCGWNSILESLSAGLPMVTWPVFADQFYNEKLVVDVLKIGVPVGSKENKFWTSIGVDAAVKREEIAKAVVLLMGKEESREMRRKARKLADASKKTIEEGGSSYNNLMQLLDELKSLKISRALEKTN